MPGRRFGHPHTVISNSCFHAKGSPVIELAQQFTLDHKRGYLCSRNKLTWTDIIWNNRVIAKHQFVIWLICREDSKPKLDCWFTGSRRLRDDVTPLTSLLTPFITSGDGKTEAGKAILKPSTVQKE
ncbi:hypothetical protein DM860_003079 [Cuscuta australis]|uniref:Reverse transcriptase zinc-binding domain-containing protein n=1 Tax=Cuscuta australis TaxID=267555 RepID=A0A328D229_9ASTE|nr:hypothetical protein DM860_003079 [Cuscuta australis]